MTFRIKYLVSKVKNTIIPKKRMTLLSTWILDPHLPFPSALRILLPLKNCCKEGWEQTRCSSLASLDSPHRKGFRITPWESWYREMEALSSVCVGGLCSAFLSAFLWCWYRAHVGWAGTDRCLARASSGNEGLACGWRTKEKMLSN